MNINTGYLNEELQTLYLIFDVDSTVNSFEALDETIKLAATEHFEAINPQTSPDEIFAMVDELMTKIETETNKGMEKGALLSETIPKRLEVAAALGVIVTETHFETIAEKAKEDKTAKKIRDEVSKLVEEFADRINIKIALVSGGPIEVIAATSGLFDENTEFHANKIVVDEDGRLDKEKSIITDAKSETVRKIIGNNPAIMIGDGGTDFEVFNNGITKDFILAGWVIKRKKILEKMEALKSLKTHLLERVSELAPKLVTIIERTAAN